MTDSGRDATRIYADLLRGALHGDEALRASQQMLEMVADSIPQAIFWKDRQLRFLGCNRVFAEMAGLNPADLIGKSDADFPWGSYKGERYQEWDTRVMESGEPRYRIRESIHLANGETRWLETTKVPLVDFDGQVVGVLGSAQDISNRLEAERALQETLEELDVRVRERTGELSAVNAALRQEIEERRRLEGLERKQRAYAEVLRDTAEAFNRLQDTDEVLHLITESLSKLVDLDVAAVFLADGTGRLSLAHYRLSDGAELHPEDPEGVRFAEALQRQDADYCVLGNPTAAGAHLGDRPGSMLLVPILSGRQRLGYVLGENFTVERYTTNDVKGLRFVADQASAAIQHIQLVERAAEVAAIDERQRLAQELHDSVSQTLWTASLGAEKLQAMENPLSQQGEIDRLTVLTRAALAEMRNLLVELMPAAIEDTDLSTLMQQLIQAFSGRKDSKVDDEIEFVEGISSRSKLTVYRIVQEALNNVSRHSQPSVVKVSVSRRGNDIKLKVYDDGGGFDPDRVPAGHYGLRIMAERAAAAGGVLCVESQASWTSVSATIPGDASD